MRGNVWSANVLKRSWIFVKMGFAVIIPMRRGYGHSEGSYAEEEGECDRARYYEAGMASALDLLATVRFMQAQPCIKAHHIILAGHSSGGFASLALASLGFDGLAGVINFSGGRGAKADQICDPEALLEAFARFGRTCRVPTLWIYSENDTYFSPGAAAIPRLCERRRPGATGKSAPFYGGRAFFLLRRSGPGLMARDRQVLY